jgi:glycerophosphoryl diester phosphodiesterase
MSWLVSPLLAAVCAAAPQPVKRCTPRAPRCPRWTVEDLFTSPTPYAIGHRGYGANPGTDPTRPVENTQRAFHRAFKDGIRIVELDLQRTSDGKIVVIHDDVLEDSTCISAMTYRELHARRPEVPLFRNVLESVRHFSRGPEPSGLVFAEIKVPIPFCDGANTSDQADVSEARLVAGVVRDIRREDMEDQVIINSGSPSILKHVAVQAPEIGRALTLNVLQLLPPEVVSRILNVPVVRIPKDDFGLAWYNVGVIARLPALDSIPNFVRVSLAVGSRAVSIDEQVLFQAGPRAPNVVAGLHATGLETIVWTIDTANQWNFAAGAGADGITTNDIALGLARQAPIEPLVACRGDDDDDRDGGEHGDRGHDGDRDGKRDGDRGGDRDATGIAARAGAPEGAELYRAYPNPFSNRMQFAYAIPSGTARVEIGVYDLAGRLLRRLVSGYESAGRHEVSWDGTDAAGVRVPTGVFFLRGSVGEQPFGMRLLYVR